MALATAYATPLNGLALPLPKLKMPLMRVMPHQIDSGFSRKMWIWCNAFNPWWHSGIAPFRSNSPKLGVYWASEVQIYQFVSLQFALITSEVNLKGIAKSATK